MHVSRLFYLLYLKLNVFMFKLVVVRGFLRCKPNRIPDKLPEDKMSENGKPDKLHDNLNRTLNGSGPFMSLFTLSLSLSHTHTHTHTLISLHSLSLLLNPFLSFCCTHYLYLSFHAHSLSLSLHTPSLYRYTTPSVSISKHTPSLSLHTLSISPPLSISLPHSLSVYSPSLSKHTLPPTIFTSPLYLSTHSLSLSLHTCTPSHYLYTHYLSTHSLSLSVSLHTHSLSTTFQVLSR